MQYFHINKTKITTAEKTCNSSHKQTQGEIQYEYLDSHTEVL